MSESTTAAVSVLARKLNRFVELSSDDIRRLEELPVRTERVRRSTDLVREGEMPHNCCLLVKGYACRYKQTNAGARQIVSFNLAGDLVDIQHLLLNRADHSVEAITDATVGWIPKSALLEVAWERPAVGKALWQDCLVDASISREWVLNVGQRDARSRVAHLICEFVARFEAAGLGSAENFDLPMTQAQIGEASGLTSVHVNRTLKVLDRDGALVRNGRHFQVFDWQRLCAIADFNCAYLHAAA